MTQSDFLSFLEACLWLAGGVMVLLLGMAGLAFWLRQKQHRARRAQQERMVSGLLQGYMRNGQGSEPRSKKDLLALRLPSHRMDLGGKPSVGKS